MSLHLTADLKSNYDTFLARVRESEIVWGLEAEDGWAVVPSNEKDCDVYVFWSDEAHAAVHCKDEWAEYSPSPIDLESFLQHWIPGMQNDGFLVGVQFNTDLAGLEVQPLKLGSDLRLSA